MKVVVTGGAGFVGSNLALMLRDDWGADVVVFDDLSTGVADRVDGVAELVVGSVTDVEKLRGTIAGADAVFHLAARNIIASSRDPLDDLAVNALGTLNLLRLCLELGVGRVVYTSTSSVYGNSKTLPVQEDTLPLFLNFYSVSKFAGEAYAQTFAHAHKLPVGVVRYSNVYGPHQSPHNPYCGVVGKFIESALKHDDLLVHGDGEQTRDFTYVADACVATLAAARAPTAVADVFNIATGVETTVNHLAETIIELTESRSRITHVPSRDIDNIRRRALNIDKAAVKLAYTPQVSLRDGLQKTIEWHTQAR